MKTSLPKSEQHDWLQEKEDKPQRSPVLLGYIWSDVL